MDRLRVMTGARRMFNGPLHKCSKASAGHCRTSLSWTASGSHAPCTTAVVRMFGATSSRSTPSSPTGQIILESPFGTVNPVDVTLPDYIWRNVDKWEDKPMIVSTYIYLHGYTYLHSCKVNMLYSLRSYT